MSSESLLWFLGLAGKWVGRASPSCLHKGKGSRNQWAVFTGYTADCNTARYVTHSQAVKTDKLLGRAEPGQPRAKSRHRQQWHTGQEQLLAPSERQSETEQRAEQKKSGTHFKNILSECGELNMQKGEKEVCLLWCFPLSSRSLSTTSSCTHVGSTQTGPLRSPFPLESGLSVYTSLWSFLWGQNTEREEEEERSVEFREEGELLLWLIDHREVIGSGFINQPTRQRDQKPASSSTSPAVIQQGEEVLNKTDF